MSSFLEKRMRRINWLRAYLDALEEHRAVTMLAPIIYSRQPGLL